MMAQVDTGLTGHWWVIVADESRVRLFHREKKYSDLETVEQFENSALRPKTADYLADRGGRSFDSHGRGRHTLVKEKSNPKSMAAMDFARQIAERVANARQGGEFSQLAIVAAPRFLGRLRAALEARSIDPAYCIDKDMTKAQTGAIRDLLDQAS